MDLDGRLPISMTIPESRQKVMLVDGSTISASPISVSADSTRDWPEDFSHENGRYQNVCIDCGEIFIGHKRRVTCKKCASPEFINGDGGGFQ